MEWPLWLLEVEYYDEVLAPTGCFSSLYAMIVNSATKVWKSLAFDIGQASLNSELAGEKAQIKRDRALASLLSQADKISEHDTTYCSNSS